MFMIIQLNKIISELRESGGVLEDGASVPRTRMHSRNVAKIGVTPRTRATVSTSKVDVRRRLNDSTRARELADDS